MHRTYVGPTSARCRQTPADIPPSSRYRPDVGMFAGYLAHSDVTIYVLNAIQSCYTLHDRWLGGIGRVVPIARCSKCSDWFVIAERLS